MTRSSRQLDNRSATPAATLAKALAPEDVRVGDYVTLLSVTCELPSFYWLSDAALLPIDEPVRIPFVPRSGGSPLKVKSICLPFVLVKQSSGKERTLDLRTCRLARLVGDYATASWKAGKRSRRKVSGRKGKKCR